MKKLSARTPYTNEPAQQGSRVSPGVAMKSPPPDFFFSLHREIARMSLSANAQCNLRSPSLECVRKHVAE